MYLVIKIPINNRCDLCIAERDKMFLVVLLVQLAFVTVPAYVIFEDCGSAYELQTVSIAGCSLKLPCYVTLGEGVPVNIEFYADFASLILDQDVVININFINLSTEVTPDSCEIVDCPVRTNAKSSFASVMSVPAKMALNQRGYLNWRVYNEKGNLVLCYSVLVQTQSPVQKGLRELLSALMTPDVADEIVDNIDLQDIDPGVNITKEYIQELINQYYAKNNLAADTK